MDSGAQRALSYYSLLFMFSVINLLTGWQGNFDLPNRVRSLLGRLDFKYIVHGCTSSYTTLPLLYRKEAERHLLFLFPVKGFLKNSARAESSYMDTHN